MDASTGHEDCQRLVIMKSLEPRLRHAIEQAGVCGLGPRPEASSLVLPMDLEPLAGIPPDGR